MRRRAPLLLALMLALSSVTWSAGLKGDERTPTSPLQPSTAADTASADDEKDRVHVEHADQLRYDSQKKLYVLTGHVVFTHKKTTLYCDEAKYNEDEDTAVATGNLRVVDPDNDCVGDLINADFDRELMVITGNVVVVHQKKDAAESPKPAAAKTETPKAAEVKGGEKEPRKLDEYKRKKSVITCDRTEYYYNDNERLIIATAEKTGQVKAVQEDKTVWADKAVYEEIPDVVTLTGNVHVKTEKGDEFRCPKAVISVKDDWIQAEGVTGVALKRDKKKKPKTEIPAPAAPAPAPPASH